MSHFLASLTVRGRSFLAAGLTAVVCGLVLLERDLVRIGLLVMLLPLVAAGYVATRSHHLRLERELSSGHVGPGEAATVRIRVTNHGAPTGVLLLEEQVAAPLGSPPRFVVPPLGRESREVLEYVVRPDVRGRHRVGPVLVRQREPFGMVERRQELPGEQSLLVLPRVVPLPEVQLGGSWYSTGEENPRSFSVGSVADVIVREYRRGDDLRRVHWRSTARTGELMVRNEEQLWQARAVVLLDDRAASHRGDGLGSSFEAAVVAAASVTVHLSRLGYHVRLVAGSGRTESWLERGRPLDPFPVLERLATISVSPDADLPQVALDEETAGGITVAILGSTEPREQAWFARFPRLSAVSLAVALDVDSWGQRSQEPSLGRSSARWLTEQGWRATSLGKGDALEAAWRGLDP